MATNSYENGFPESSEVISDADVATAEIGNFIENGIDPISRRPFTAAELKKVLEADKRTPAFTESAFSGGMKQLCAMGILGYHEESEEYYLKNLA